MRKINVEYEVYKFSELKKEVQEKVIEKYYENEDYYFLEEDLTELCKDSLQTAKIEVIDGLKLYFSLSSSQGDGLCFVGNFEYNNVEFNITHHGRYYHSNSVNFDIANTDSNENMENAEEILKEFRQVYLQICSQLEKEGYSIIEYRPSISEFSELAESNDYEYLENGKIFKGGTK